MKIYLVYDGRANLDVDSAAVIDSILGVTENEAIEEFREDWGDTDSVLFEYDDVDGVLENERMVDII